jgi:hypothetical protein
VSCQSSLHLDKQDNQQQTGGALGLRCIEGPGLVDVLEGAHHIAVYSKDDVFVVLNEWR